MRTSILFTAAMIILLFSCKEDEIIDPAFYACNLSFADSSASNVNNAKYQALLDDITGSGVPGIMMCVFKPGEGTWIGASGKADLANGLDLKACNITRTGSTVKTFTAVTILKLAEEGRFDLDDKAVKNALKAFNNLHIENRRMLLKVDEMAGGKESRGEFKKRKRF